MLYWRDMLPPEGEAAQGKARDQAFVHEHIEALWTAAQEGYTRLGRGALVVDTLLYGERADEEHNPHLEFAYMPQGKVETLEDERLRERVRVYDPTQELVVVLVRPGRQMLYRVSVDEEAERQ